MVHGSSNGGKKKAKKAAKRKPVNLQPQYPSKFPKVVHVDDGDSSAVDEHHVVSHDMYPSNHAEYAQGDFHMHRYEVIAKAAANGVVYISLTDHDTMAGVSEAMDTGRSLGVFVLPSVEICAEEAGAENLHILGYFCPGTDSVALEAKLLAIRQARHKRGKEMLRKLAEMGIHLNWDRVLEIAGEAAPGRPHVAEALVEGGHVSNFREAFSRYLRNDGPAYAELCKTKWRVPLASKVVEICTRASEVEKSTIWTELFPLVKDTVCDRVRIEEHFVLYSLTSVEEFLPGGVIARAGKPPWVGW
ncbi:hypothetical protein DYB30_004933 [Aphanomyces astaci]|uniref:Polymerase/histidinol phosphatase N-terminal domain-containing protein n=2 Tax=Aphanomyces astaci TaxID=112090 RepID=A0A397C9W1_APHAT|nr:hypothetical protein DYB30_004933 [Aphanomyces astaci]